MKVLWILLGAVIATTVVAEDENPAENTASDPTPDSCQWLDPEEGFYISGYDNKHVANVDVDDCKKACEDETGFNCFSFDYRPPQRDCYLSNRDRFSIRLSTGTAANNVYYERNCRADFPVQCQWEAPVAGMKIAGQNNLVLSSKTAEECQQACEDEKTFVCMSFDYTPSSTCYLTVASRFTATLTASAPDVYYERNCQTKYQKCSGASPNSEWSEAWHGLRLPATIAASMKMSVEECKLACLQQDLYNCRSFEYAENVGYCYLHWYNRQDYSDFNSGLSVHHVLVTDVTKDYYELIECPEEASPQPVNPVNCEWLEAVDNYYLYGNDKKTIASSTVDDCKKACEDETTFECNSFDFHKTLKNCYLQTADRYSHRLSGSAAYAYYERNCKPYFTSECEWERMISYYIPGNDIQTYTGKTAAECKALCEDDVTFHCMSFDYRRDIQYCYLQRLSRDTTQLTSHYLFDYYGRNCRDQYRNCSSTATVEWAGPWYGRFIPGIIVKTMTGITRDDCRKACLDVKTFICTSFSYIRTSGTCYLQALNSDTKVIAYHQAYTYDEIKSCSATATEVTPTNDCTWVKIEGHHLPGNEIKTISGSTPEECQQQCVQTYPKDIRSIDYIIASKVCYCQFKDRTQVVLGVSAAINYYERQCPEFDPSALCVWQVKDAMYLGGPAKTIGSSTEEDCQKACEEETTFICKSFNFVVTNNQCQLNIKDRYGNTLTANVNYIYHERNCRPKFSSCHSDSNPTWVGPFYGQILTGFDVRVLTAISLADCKEACLQQDKVHCIAIEYTESTKRCVLQGGNREDSNLVASTTANYYEIGSCPEAELPTVPKRQCTWKEPVDGACISGQDIKSIANLDEDDCQAACEDYEGEPCLSVDYVITTKLCYLNRVSRDTVATATCANFRYYELDCSDKYTEQCEWTGPVLNNRLGRYNKIVAGATADDCKKACEDDVTINCVSFDYLTTTKKCYLSLSDRTDGKLIPTASWDFYERVCDNARRPCGTDEAIGSWAEPKHGRGKAATLLTLTGPRTVDECKDACVQTSDIRCASFDFVRAAGVCYLNGKTREDKTLAYVDGYDYYELTSCSGPLVQPASKNCTWREAFPGLVIFGQDKKAAKSDNADDCKKICEEETSFYCASFDFYPATQTCYFQSVDRSQVVTASNSAFTYYERDCQTADEKVCTWEKIEHAILAGQNTKRVNDQSPEKCQELCRAENTFICASFDYDFVNRVCYLSIGNRYSGSITIKQTIYDYYELNCLSKYKTCNYHSDATWADAIRGKNTNGVVRATSTKISVEQCKKSCLQATDFHCRSFVYRYDQACFLKSSSVSAGDILVDTTNIDYYELEECSGPLPVEKPVTECVWRDDLVNYVLGGNDKRVLSGMTEENCKAACVEERTFVCNSADFNTANNYCYLQTADRSTVRLNYIVGWRYYERDCSASFTEECSWTNVGRSTLPGLDVITLASQTVDECQENCEKEPSFHCLSFDFIRDSETCRLQMYNRYFRPLATSSTDDFHERNCDNAYKNCGPDSDATWADPVYGKRLLYTYVPKSIVGQSLDQCKTACLQAHMFHCQGITFFRTSNTCYLLTETLDQNGLTPHADAEYHELLNCNEVPPVSCGKNMVYKKCGNICRPSCADPDGSECPDAPCEAGCFCYTGMVYDGVGSCIEPEQCGCAVPGATDRMEVGATILSNSCTRQCSCKADGIEAECITVACEENEVCYMGNGTQTCQCLTPNYVHEGKCTVPLVCGDGMLFSKCASDCLPTCDDPKGTNCTGGQCAPKCVCKDGLVYDSASDTCGSPDTICGCPISGSNDLAQIGVTFLTDDCSKSCICESNGADLTCTKNVCPKNTVCKKQGGLAACVCEDPYSTFKKKCTHRCEQPKKAGGCTGNDTTRFFFNSKKQKCRKFTYSGCKGSGNNFVSKDECKTFCLEFQTPPECLLKKDPGPCTNFELKYYFDGQVCRKLQYGGCQGNDNNFPSKDACAKYCKKAPTTQS